MGKIVIMNKKGIACIQKRLVLTFLPMGKTFLRALCMDIPHLFAVSRTPMVGLGLGELGGFENPDILVEPVFPTALLQSFYLRNDLVQDMLIVDNAQWVATVTGIVK
jgi:hypothetical protein